MPKRPDPTACRECSGLGEITVQFRAVSPRDVSPCDSEREERCEECAGTGKARLVDCSCCGDEIDVEGGEFVADTGECKACHAPTVAEAAEARGEASR